MATRNTAIMTFDFLKIDEYQIEITSYCNAACPQCPRNHNGHGINPHMPLTHLNRDTIDRAFPVELCQRLRQIFLCGSYGDPIMHPDLLDILRDFRAKNPELWLYMHTNGGVHDAEYWRELASIIGNQGQIDFGIDGVGDTLSVYRRNVKFSKVIENAQAFIKAGGRAQWNFIVFRHNEHQVNEAQAMAKELGFSDILIRNTGRFMHHGTLTEMSHWPVADGTQLRPPKDRRYQNRSMRFLPRLKKQYTDMREYFDTTEIRCDALLGNKVAINAEGLVLPCNFFNHNLYDRRFHDRTCLPGSHDLSFVNGHNQVRSFLESFGLHNLNIKHQPLSDIFSNTMWQALVDSWQKTISDGRLFECAMTCGQKLTKVWDQGGNNR